MTEMATEEKLQHMWLKTANRQIVVTQRNAQKNTKKTRYFSHFKSLKKGMKIDAHDETAPWEKRECNAREENNNK